MAGTLVCVSVLVFTHERCLDHEAGRHHPERPDRLRAALAPMQEPGDLAAVVEFRTPSVASREAIERVHPTGYVAELAALSAAGGGRIDADTSINAASFEAASLAAGSGLDAIEALAGGDHEAAFCAVRPPGHHATVDQAMGFCLLNSAAIAATSLADAGERVVIFDYDAHHGNGTEAIFADDPRVLFISCHQYPQYPGTGWLTDCGVGPGVGTTMNLPFPAGTTGDVYRRAFDEVIGPAIEDFAPSWLILSAGFDAHRADPITDLGLSAGDYRDLTKAVLSLVPAGRRLVFLEGGYDLGAITSCTSAVVATLAGAPELFQTEGVDGAAAEVPTAGGPGREVVDAVRELWARE